MDYVSQLKAIPKTKDFLICFDSDGCVFDTMEIKQKECFCPCFIKHFGLQPASKYAREVWEFVNLYSKDRGCNRFLAVKRAAELISKRKVFAERNIRPLHVKSLEKWLNEESKLGNPALDAKVKASGDEELTKLLAWSKEVNARIADMVYGIPPFPGVIDVLKAAQEKAAMMVVSQTPIEALSREWKENNIAHYLSIIAGQEHGTKTEHIKYAVEGKNYDLKKILMVGDAPGDFKAAKANNTLFFPIIPGEEEKSWAELASKGLKKFFNGTFTGEYQQNLLDEFDKALPENPQWK